MTKADIENIIDTIKELEEAAAQVELSTVFDDLPKTELFPRLKKYLNTYVGTKDPIPENRLLNERNLTNCSNFIKTNNIGYYVGLEFIDLSTEEIQRVITDLEKEQMYKEAASFKRVVNFVEGIVSWMNDNTLGKPEIEIKPEVITPIQIKSDMHLKTFVESIMGITETSLSSRLSDPFNIGKHNAVTPSLKREIEQAEGRMSVAYAEFLESFDHDEYGDACHPKGIVWSALQSNIRQIKAELLSELVSLAEGKETEATKRIINLLSDTPNEAPSKSEILTYLMTKTCGYDQEIVNATLEDIDKYSAATFNSMEKIAAAVFDQMGWARPVFYADMVKEDEFGNEVMDIQEYEDTNMMVNVVFGTSWIQHISMVYDILLKKTADTPELRFYKSHIAQQTKEITNLKGLVIEISEDTSQNSAKTDILNVPRKNDEDKVPQEGQKAAISDNDFFKMFKKDYAPHKQQQLLSHIKEVASEEDVHTYLGALASASKNLFSPKNRDFSKLSRTFLLIAGLDPKIARNLREVKIGEANRKRAEDEINRIDRSHAPKN